MQDYQSTLIGQKFADDEVEHAGESGFAIVRYGRNAFNIRIAMTDVAEKTLDLVWITEDEGGHARSLSGSSLSYAGSSRHALPG